MSEERIRKIFAERLKYYMETRGKQPVDIVNDLKLPFSTVSSWLSGQKLPRMGKIELLASYLGCEKSRLCEQYGVNENDRRRMMGHSFGSDITNGTYGHRTVEQLRNEIIKIKAPI